MLALPKKMNSREIKWWSKILRKLSSSSQFQISENVQIKVIPGSEYVVDLSNHCLYSSSKDYIMYELRFTKPSRVKTLCLCQYGSCSKSFNSPYKFFDHLRSHTKEKIFVCDHPGCGNSYTQLGNLKVHQQKHGEEL